MSTYQCCQCGSFEGIPDNIDHSNLHCSECRREVIIGAPLLCQACSATFWLPDDYGRVRIKCPKCSKWADIPDALRALAKLEPRLARAKFARVKASLEQEGILDPSVTLTLGSTLARFSDICALLLVDDLPFMARRLPADDLWESLSLMERLRDQSAESCSWWDYYPDAVVASFLTVWYRIMMRTNFRAFAGLVEKQLAQSISAPYEIIFWNTLSAIHDNLGPARFLDYQDWLTELAGAREREKSDDPLRNEQLYRFHLDAMERIPDLMELYSLADCRIIMKRIAAVSLAENSILDRYSSIGTAQYAPFLGCQAQPATEPESYSTAM